MSENAPALGLFPVAEDRKPVSVVPRSTGIVPYQGIRALIGADEVSSIEPIDESQIQPASLDLRLGSRAYRVRASFLPGPDSSVMQRVEELDGMPPIDLSQGAVFEKGAVYLVEVQESVRLTNGVEAFANPKSSTGRLDVLTRLITDRATAFDRIERGYKGPVYVEVAPLTFSIVVRTGSRLNQLRFQRGSPALAASAVKDHYEAGKLIGTNGERLPLRNELVPVSVDLRGDGPGSVVGYKAKKNTNKIDVDRIKTYEVDDYWDSILASDGRLNLDKDDFYILATREDVGVPPEMAAEMVPFDYSSGEFRVHYAGFFDPGFGWRDNQASGSKGVLEVRSYGVSFTLEHAQIVGWLRYSSVARGKPDKTYGAGLKSNYQGQGVALSKHFLVKAPGSGP